MTPSTTQDRLRSISTSAEGFVADTTREAADLIDELYETLIEARIHILDDSALARRIEAALAKVRGEQ